MKKYIFLCIISVLCMISCSSNGKSGYKISDLYKSKNTEILEKVQEASAKYVHCPFEVIKNDRHLSNGSYNRYEDGSFDSFGFSSSGYMTIFNWLSDRYNFILDGLNNVQGDEIKRGDIIYYCYDAKEERFIFVKYDFNKPINEQKCYCSKD